MGWYCYFHWCYSDNWWGNLDKLRNCYGLHDIARKVYVLPLNNNYLKDFSNRAPLPRFISVPTHLNGHCHAIHAKSSQVHTTFSHPQSPFLSCFAMNHAKLCIMLWLWNECGYICVYLIGPFRKGGGGGGCGPKHEVPHRNFFLDPPLTYL